MSMVCDITNSFEANPGVMMKLKLTHSERQPVSNF